MQQQPLKGMPPRTGGNSVAQMNGEALSPIRSAPSLTTINGFGFKLYGNSNHDAATDSYMTTHYFVALFLPLFPIARYRVVSDGDGSYHFLGKGRLRDFDKVHLVAFAAAVAYAIATAGLK